MRRYPSYVSPTAEPPAPTIEAKRQAPGEREPVHVRASVMEHLAVGMSWAFVVGAVGIAVRVAAVMEPDYWRLLGVLALVVFATVTCWMATWHYTQDEKLKGRDLRAWRELEAKVHTAHRDVEALRRQNFDLQEELHLWKDVPVDGKKPEKPIAKDAPTEETAQQRVIREQKERYEKAARAIAFQWENGYDYTRDYMVKMNMCSPSAWKNVMDDLQKKGMVARGGQGARRELKIHRASDILHATNVRAL